MERLHHREERDARERAGMIRSCRSYMRALAAFVALSVGTASVGAQAPDTVLMRQADTLTVGDYCRVMRSVMQQPSVAAAVADERPYLDQALQRVCDPRAAALRLRELTGRGAPTLSSVARLRQDALSSVLAAPLDSAMTTLYGRLRDPALIPVIRTALGDAANTEFFTIVEVPQALFLLEARDRTLARLAKYERKLGPQSPKLNGIEILMNYAAQRWIPGFAPSPTRGPSPLELITSYVPSYGTVAAKRVVAASATEFGVRHYLFGPSWGQTGWRGIIRPAYMSAGLLVASNRSNSLAWPWDRQSRPGAFLGWGEVKVGWVPGRTGSVMIARQVQFVPFAF